MCSIQFNQKVLISRSLCAFVFWLIFFLLSSVLASYIFTNKKFMTIHWYKYFWFCFQYYILCKWLTRGAWGRNCLSATAYLSMCCWLKSSISECWKCWMENWEQNSCPINEIHLLNIFFFLLFEQILLRKWI